MSRDIVDRLREVTAFLRFETGDRVAAAASLSEEAANEIEELRRRLGGGCGAKGGEAIIPEKRARDRHYWIRSNITEDIFAWEVGYLDQHGHWWIFGISGWFEESQLEEVGPELVPPGRGEDPNGPM